MARAIRLFYFTQPSHLAWRLIPIMGRKRIKSSDNMERLEYFDKEVS